MKALILETTGAPGTLKLAEHPEPIPSPDDVLVNVAAVGLNPVDYKTAAMGFPTWQWPHILGLDVAGVVARVGESVTGWQPGDRVFYHGDLSKPGGYAEYTTAPAHIVTRIPDGVTFEDAAAIPCAGYTAWQILSRRIPVRSGSTVLVHGGAGGVGGFAVQLARHLNTRVLTTCSEGNFDHVKNLGAHHAIDYKNEDLHSRVMALTDQNGADVIINTIDEASATRDLDLLAHGGHLASVVGLPDISRLTPFTKAVSVHEIALGSAHLNGGRNAQADLAAMGEELITMVREGKLATLLTETVDLASVPEALTRISRRHVKGKIVAVL
ncbi:MAG: zinc-binding dehydrogenase [Desulfobacterales bacterium]|nr:zinc-binding dehydrogenase [Desulfobacterales bacterium]